MAHASRKVGLVHHIDGGNLGEDATLAAIMENVKTRWPDAEIVGLAMVRDDPSRTLTWPFSHKPANSDRASLQQKTTLKDKVKSLLPNNSLGFKFLKAIYGAVRNPVAVISEVLFLIKSLRAIWSFDVVVLSAGDQFGESWGRHRLFRYASWKFPYTIFKWVLLARTAHAKPTLLNVSAGPLRGMTHAFVRGALSLADCVSFRDEKSREQFPLGRLNGRSFVFPDPAYSHDVGALRATESTRHIRPVVGLAPMVLGDPGPLLDSFLFEVASFASWVTRNDYRVRLFCTNINVDSGALCRLQEILTADNSNRSAMVSLDRVHQWSTEELLMNMSSMDYIVTSRFHGVVFAHLLNKPVLAISNHSSVRSLMNDLGLSEYWVNIDKFDSNVLNEAFLSMVSHRDEIKSRMAKQVASLQEKLATQFDELFPHEVRKKVTDLHSGTY